MLSFMQLETEKCTESIEMWTSRVQEMLHSILFETLRGQEQSQQERHSINIFTTDYNTSARCKTEQ